MHKWHTTGAVLLVRRKFIFWCIPQTFPPSVLCCRTNASLASIKSLESLPNCCQNCWEIYSYITTSVSTDFMTIAVEKFWHMHFPFQNWSTGFKTRWPVLKQDIDYESGCNMYMHIKVIQPVHVSKLQTKQKKFCQTWWFCSAQWRCTTCGRVCCLLCLVFSLLFLR